MSQKYYCFDRFEMLAFLPKKYNKVLEIGCGEGVFLQQLNQMSEKWGIEPSKEAADKAVKIADKILIGSYNDCLSQLPDEYFDLIICNDVIEHMVDYDFFFSSIKQKMSDNGCLIGSIPNVRFYKNLFNLLIKKDWLYKAEGGILDKTHVRFFTKKSFYNILIEHNFTIDLYYGINSFVYKSASSIKSFIRIIMLSLIILISFGWYSDIQYLQYGFKIKVNKNE